MTHRTRTIGAAALAAALAFGGVACGDDEDGDGATTDEEIGELDQQVEEGGDEIEQEVQEGEEEMEDEG